MVELLQPRAFRGDLGGLRGKFPGTHTVLPGQRFDRGHALFHLFLTRGIRVEVVQVAGQFARCVIDADQCFVDHRNQRGHPGIEHRHAAQQGEGAARRLVRVAVLGFEQQPDRSTRGFGEAATVGQARALLREALHFAGLELQCLEFPGLVLQQVKTLVALLRGGFQRGEFGCPRRALTMGLCHRAGERSGAREGIEQRALCGWSCQGLELVLAVDVDEPFAHFPQHLRRDLLPVEVGARLALPGHDPPHHQFVVCLDRLLLEQVAQALSGSGQFEGGGDFGTLGPMADHFGARPSAGDELQGIHEDGFTGTGLASQDSEAGSQVDLDGVDDREITDVQVREHGTLSPGCRSCDVPS